MVPPPSFGDNLPPPGHTGRERTKDGLPLQPARGLNTSALFAERISDPAKRTERVETAVQELRNDFDSILPSLLRLVAIEKDIDELVVQLESLTIQDPSFTAAMAQTTTESAPTNLVTTPQTTQTKPKPPDSRASSTTIKEIRTGIRENGARLVIDLSAPGSYSHELDQTSNSLRITMPQATWPKSAKTTFVKNPLITSWNIAPHQNGSRITVSLKPGVRVSSHFKLDAAPNKNDRIVFDLE